jgi:hypothetical protein
MLVRRPAERTLSVAIAWFLAIPTFVVGYASIVWPLGFLLPHDCFAADCPAEHLGSLVPPFFAPAGFGLAIAFILALALRRAVYVRPRSGWPIVAVVGGIFVAAAIVVVVANGGRWEVALVAFVWPMTPGLVALDAVRRARRLTASS